MLACNIAEKAAAARGAFAISSMAADTKTKDDWPSLLPPPPKFNVPPPPIPAFVEACRHPPNPHDSTVNMEMLTNDDLLHLSSYLIVGCILLMVLFTMAACSLRCCTMNSTSHDWQRDGLLDNCGDDEAAAAASEVDAQQQHSDQQQPRPWWQLSSNANSLWKQRLRQSIESLRHFRWHPPPEYSINDDEGGGHQTRPLRPTRSSSKSSSSSKAKDWPLSSLDGSNVEDGRHYHHETDLEQQSCSHIRPHIRH